MSAQEIIELIHQHFPDHEDVEYITEQIEEGYNFADHASTFAEKGELHNKDIAVKLIKYAVSNISDCREALECADAISNPDAFNNKESARKIYKLAVSKIEDSSDACLCATRIANSDSFNDKSWAREVMQIAIDKVDNTYEAIDCTNNIANEDSIGDKAWAREVMQIAIDKVGDSYDAIACAENIADEDYIGEKDWARDLYKIALEKSEDASEEVNCAQSISNEMYLGDKDWARNIIEKAVSRFETCPDAVSCAEIIANEDNIGDRDWAKDVYKIALESAGSDKDELSNCIQSIKYTLEDEEWADELLNKYGISIDEDDEEWDEEEDEDEDEEEDNSDTDEENVFLFFLSTPCSKTKDYSEDYFEDTCFYEETKDGKYVAKSTEDSFDIILETLAAVIEANDIRAIDNGRYYFIYKGKPIPADELQDKTDIAADIVSNAEEIGGVLIAVVTDSHISQWDYNFIKMSKYLRTVVNIFGPHPDFGRNVFQRYDNGEFDSGIVEQEDTDTYSLSYDEENYKSGDIHYIDLLDASFYEHNA